MSISRINLIGCGRLGKTIAALIKRTGAASIEGVVTASFESALEAVRFIGQGRAYQTLSELPEADLYLIATPDDLIQKTGAELVLNNTHSQGKIIAHCSGFLDSDVFIEAKQQKCRLASIHPLKSFAHPEEAIQSFSGTYCALEGDASVLPLLTALFEKIGARVFKINQQQKTLYHAASVIASNYLVTLYHQALLCYEKSGIDKTVAKELVSTLMTETFQNLKHLDPQEALTGPIQRGDLRTIQGHLHALEQLPLTKDLYAALGQAALILTQHDEKKQQELKARLAGDGNPPS